MPHHLEENHAPSQEVFIKLSICLKHKLRCWGDTFCQSHTTKEREVAWRWLEKCITYNKPPKGSKLPISAKRWLEECTIGLISHLRKLLPWYIFNFNTRVCRVIILFFKIHFVNEKNNLWNFGNKYRQLLSIWGFLKWGFLKDDILACVETWDLVIIEL
jgi:hypothetical protein